MSIKAQLEALIYAAEDPITLDQMAALLKDDLLALKTTAEETPQLSDHLQTAESQAQESQLHTEQAPENAEDHLGAVEEAAVAAAEPPAIEIKTKKTKEKPEKAELRALLKPY